HISSKLLVNDIRFIPISALQGDNVVNRSENMSWYQGAPLLHTLETLYISSDFNKIDARFPVQTVIRPRQESFHDFRGYAGRIASGIFRKGDEITVFPSGRRSRIRSIHAAENEIAEAYAPLSVTITLDDDVDVSRGNMLVRSNNLPEVVTEFDAMLCWLHHKPATPPARFSIMHTSNGQKAIL